MPCAALSLSRLALGCAIGCLTIHYSDERQRATARLECEKASDCEWPAYSGDYQSRRYSPLRQITEQTAQRLSVSWSREFDDGGYRNESSPLMVDGALYFTVGPDRKVVSLDALTGVLRWSWTPEEGVRAKTAPRRGPGRGVAIWKSSEGTTVYVVTPGFQLVALDAQSGLPRTKFGKAGFVDLKALLSTRVDLDRAPIGSSSPPIVHGGVVVVGPAFSSGLRPNARGNIAGEILGIHAENGRRLWTFRTIPLRGDVGNHTWKEGSWRYTGNAGAWAPLTLDPRRGYLYVPVEAATSDLYGGHRPGDNLFSSSLVCLSLTTGRRVWHYQLVRHDVWDRDVPAAPILADVEINGLPREIVAQVTKQAYLYVLDRFTGVPIWPMTELAVQQSDVPGESLAPFQSVPTKPTAFDRQGISIDDLIDFTPELRSEAIKELRRLRIGMDPFTPPVAPELGKWSGTLLVPGLLGGGNWEGAALDVETGVLFVPSFTSPSLIRLVRGDGTDVEWRGDPRAPPTIRGLPLLKPPYSRITAIDLRTGATKWSVPNGDTPVAVITHPTLAEVKFPSTGALSRPAVLATRELLVVAEGPGGRPLLHILNKITGVRTHQVQLPGPSQSVPVSYATAGRQFLTLWVRRAGPPVRSVLVSLAVAGPLR